MPRRTAFIDESKRRSTYLLCAAAVVNADLGLVRRRLETAKGNHSGIHMNDFNHEERMTCARLLPELGVEVFLFQARGGRERAMRDALLADAANHLASVGVGEVVIESCGQDREDRRILQRTLGPRPAMSYRHAGKEELLLALSDIHAWCWGRDRRFQEIVKPVTTTFGVVRL